MSMESMNVAAASGPPHAARQEDPLEYFHALGLATAAWSALRHETAALFAETCGLEPRVSHALIGDMRIGEMLNRIRACALMRASPPATLEGIEHAAASVEIFRQNRIYFDCVPVTPHRGIQPDRLDERAGDLRRLSREMWRFSHSLQDLSRHVGSVGSGSELQLPTLPPLPDNARHEAIVRLRDA